MEKKGPWVGIREMRRTSVETGAVPRMTQYAFTVYFSFVLFVFLSDLLDVGRTFTVHFPSVSLVVYHSVN